MHALLHKCTYINPIKYIYLCPLSIERLDKIPELLVGEYIERPSLYSSHERKSYIETILDPYETLVTRLTSMKIVK